MRPFHLTFISVLAVVLVSHGRGEEDVNVAEGKSATQIADSYDAVAGLAVDGVTNQDSSTGECAYAYHDISNAWWMVDLGSVHAIHRVIIYGSDDIAYDTYLGFISVRVSNDSDVADHLASDQCAIWNQSTFPLGGPKTLECDQVMYGRYVSIQRTGGVYLNRLILCEVMVMGRQIGENLGLGKPTWQSSVRTLSPWAVAGLAVDGNSNTNFGNGESCTHTEGDPQSWWTVDLGDDYRVSRVIITNRGDCCGSRLSNFNIGLTSSSPNETPPTPAGYDVLYHQTEAVGDGETVTFDIDDSASGRYLVIQLLTPEAKLTLCEVEVYGQQTTGV